MKKYTVYYSLLIEIVDYDVDVKLFDTGTILFDNMQLNY